MTTNIDFSHLSVGELATIQYKQNGIIFTSKAIITPDKNVPSSDKVLLSQSKAGGEYPVQYISALFTSPHHTRISFYASSPTGRGCSGMITARDSRGKQVATTSFGGANGWIFVEVVCEKGNIARFEIHGSSRSSFDRICGLGFDEVVGLEMLGLREVYEGTGVEVSGGTGRADSFVV